MGVFVASRRHQQLIAFNKISNAAGLEKMTGVTGITLSDNNLSNLDVSSNTNLKVLAVSGNNLSSLDVSRNLELLNLRVYGNPLASLNVTNNTKLQVLLAHDSSLTSIDISKNLDLTNPFTVEDILVKANVTPMDTIASLGYDLSGLNILNSSQSVENTSNYIVSNSTVMVSNYSGANGYIQVSSQAQGRTYKLQLPKFVKFNANGGSNAPSTVACYSETATGTCTVNIPSTGPTRTGYIFKGYADSESATSDSYIGGGQISLSEPKTLYAVWGEISQTRQTVQLTMLRMVLQIAIKMMM